MCDHASSEVVLLPDGICTWKDNRSVCLDRCIASIVPTIWAAGLETVGSCCGHGKEDASVVVESQHGIEYIARIASVLERIDPQRRWRILQWSLILAAKT